VEVERAKWKKFIVDFVLYDRYLAQKIFYMSK
jgi:hypothetical protein